MVCFVNQLITPNLGNKQNFEIKVSRKTRKLFLKFVTLSFEVSISKFYIPSSKFLMGAMKSEGRA